MIRHKRGRPEMVGAVFVEDFARLDATTFLAKSRGCFEHALPQPYWTLRWSIGGHERILTAYIEVTTTAQTFGGSRRWWTCPGCDRRSGVLLVDKQGGRIGCRQCFNARYLSDYLGRYRRRRQGQLWRELLWITAEEAQEAEATELRAARRRGVKQGRRVFKRAVRQLLKKQREYEDAPDLLASYWKTSERSDNEGRVRTDRAKRGR
jgi:hypothetical protein